jgi:hypothetical protein
MPSAIDSSFIGAGPVNKASFAAQLDTAEAEITALQAATIEARAAFSITTPVATIQIAVPASARSIRWHLSSLQVSATNNVRVRFRRSGETNDDSLATDYYTMWHLHQQTGGVNTLAQDDSAIMILPGCGTTNQANTAQGVLTSNPGGHPALSGTFYSNNSTNNNVGTIGGRLKRVGAIDRITFLLGGAGNFLAGNIYLEWRA